jgi:hypothetical protein
MQSEVKKIVSEVKIIHQNLKTMRTFTILLFLLTPVYLFSQDKTYTIDTIQINSEVLKENRRVIIYKSPDISKMDSVKFLYLLEGEYSNQICQKIYKRFRDSISNLIIVGIMNPERRRDMLYVHGAVKFLDFMTTELIPFVEKDYKTSVRILNGHSFCGGFTIYSLITKPDCFNHYIATSPTPIMKLISKHDYQKIDSICKHHIVFYFSFGSKDMGQVRRWALKLKDNLTGMKFHHLDWRFEILECRNHSNSDVIALLHALSIIQR